MRSAQGDILHNEFENYTLKTTATSPGGGGGNELIPDEHWPWIFNGLMQERCNSTANALELCLSCTNQFDALVTTVCDSGILYISRVGRLYHSHVGHIKYPWKRQGSTALTESYGNALVSERFDWNLTYIIFKLILVTDGWGISCEMPPLKTAFQAEKKLC